MMIRDINETEHDQNVSQTKLINGHIQEARSRLKALRTHDVVPPIDWCLIIVSTLF